MTDTIKIYINNLQIVTYIYVSTYITRQEFNKSMKVSVNVRKKNIVGGRD